MTITIDCNDVNQVLPWAARATLDHARRDEKTKNHYFVEPIEIAIRHPDRMVEFFEASMGNPFRKLDRALSGSSWEFKLWTIEGSVHGMLVMNDDLSIGEMAEDGVFTSVCLAFLMECHDLGEKVSPGTLRIIITRPWIADGTSLFFNEGDMELAGLYWSTITASMTISTYPWFSTPMTTWIKDLSVYQCNPLTVGYRDSFFRKIAKPMAAAGLAVEDRNFDTAREILSSMPSNNDWKLAGEEFVDLQMEKES